MAQITKVILVLAVTRAVWGQGAVLPIPVPQLFSNNGIPLAGGSVCTYASGTTTPSATYTDYTLSVQNPLCVPLDSSGRASLWGGSTVYRMILKDNTGVTLWTKDGVQAGGGGSQPFYNATNTAGPAYEVQGVTVIDAGKNATFATLSCTGTPCGSAGGGGGTPGVPLNSVQFNNSGVFAGSANMTWTNASNLLTVQALNSSSPGIVVGSGYLQADQGLYATTSTALNYNVIQAPGGGMAALSFTASNYIQAGHSAGAPSSPTTGTPGGVFSPGALYWDDTSHAMQVYNNSGTWVSLGGGSGSPGGSNTQIQFNSSGSFGGDSKLTWVGASTNLLTVTGTVQASVGFDSTGTTNNTIQAPNGGVSGKFLVASDSLFLTEEAQPVSLSGAGQARIYADSTAHNIQVSQNGGAYAPLGGGGGGTPAGSNTQIQFNNSGSFGATSNLTWTTVSGVSYLQAIATSSTEPGIYVGTGFIQADQGLYATSATATNYNVIQAPAGGVYANSLRAIKYVQTGSSSGAPTLTSGDTLGAGALYWDTSGTPCEKLYNGSSWACLTSGAGGITGINGQTGPTITIQGSGSAGPSGPAIGVVSSANTITLTTPQALGTAATPSFAQVNVGGSSQTGAAGLFENNSSTIPAVYVTQAGTGPALQIGGSALVFGDLIFQSGVAPPQIDATGMAAAFNINGATATNGNIVVNPGNVTGLSSFVVNGHNNSGGGSVSTGDLIVNEITGAGANISMKHGGTFDASWAAGSSAAFDLVDNTTTHRLVVLQGGKTLVGRTTDDGSGALLQVNGAYSGAGILSVTTASSPAANFTNNSTIQSTVNITQNGAGVALAVVGHIESTGSAPTGTYSSGSVSSFDSGSDDTHGVANLSGSAGGTLTVTFAQAFNSTPFCVANGATYSRSTSSSTQAKFVNVAGTVVPWVCLQ